jgi:hypothetical protein
MVPAPKLIESLRDPFLLPACIRAEVERASSAVGPAPGAGGFDTDRAPACRRRNPSLKLSLFLFSLRPPRCRNASDVEAR